MPESGEPSSCRRQRVHGSYQCAWQCAKMSSDDYGNGNIDYRLASSESSERDTCRK